MGGSHRFNRIALHEGSQSNRTPEYARGRVHGEMLSFQGSSAEISLH